MWPHCLRCAPATIEWLVFWLWLAFGWLLLDIQRFCCPVLWILLSFRWNISQFRGMGLKSGRVHMPSQTVTSWRWHLEPWSRLTSVVCSHAFGLAKHLEIMTDGGGVMPTLECRTQTLMAWCVSLDCFAEDVMYGLMSLAFCNALICRWLQPSPWTWAISVFQPASALLCITCRFWLVSGLTSMMLIACHPSLSLSRKSWPHNAKKKPEGGTPRVYQQLGACTLWQVFPCLDLLAVDACLYLFAKTLLLAFVLELVAVQPSKICHFRSSSDNIAVSVCHWLFTQQGTTARRGLSTAILSVTCPWHIASAL